MGTDTRSAMQLKESCHLCKKKKITEKRRDTSCWICEKGGAGLTEPKKKKKPMLTQWGGNRPKDECHSDWIWEECSAMWFRSCEPAKRADCPWSDMCQGCGWIYSMEFDDEFFVSCEEFDEWCWCY